MKKKITVVLLILAMLTCLCGCSTQSMSEKIIDIRKNWFTNLEADVVDIRTNWYSNLKSSAEEFGSYTYADLERETANYMNSDFEGVGVADEEDFRKALADTESNEIIVVQASITLTEDLVVPAGKAVLFESGVIFIVPMDVSVTIEEGAGFIFSGSSYFVLNELGTCSVASDGFVTISKESCLLMVLDDALTVDENADFNMFGLFQQGSVFNAYSQNALNIALISATDGSVINLQPISYGSESSYYIYDLNKSVSIVGSETENARTTIYGGFVATADGVSISGLDIYMPTSNSQATVPSSIGTSYKVGAGVTIASGDATVTDCVFYATSGVQNCIEIYPYFKEDGTQSYSITGNTFVGFGDLQDETTAPVIVYEYDVDVSWFDKLESSSYFGISETDQINLALNNEYGESELRLAIIDVNAGDKLKSIYVSSMDITEDFTFECDYYISGDWNVTNAHLTVVEGAEVTLGYGVTFNMDEKSSMDIADGASVVLQSKSVFETYGEVTGSVSGSGNFIDWPNYIQFNILLESEDGEWESDVVLGEYVGYTAGQLESLYYATKLSGGDETIVGYNIGFKLTPNGSELADDYVLTEDITLYASVLGKSIPVYYDDNGGSGSGSNRSEWTFPRTVYLENATTRKTDEFFAGWVISGGTFDGQYVAVMDSDFMLELFDAGYDSLSLKATWISSDNKLATAKANYLDAENSYSQYDAYCAVYVYTTAGTDSGSYDVDDYEYGDDDFNLIKVDNATAYNSDAYIYFELADGYEIASVTVTDSLKNEYDMTNQAIVALNNDMPMVYSSNSSFTIVVKTQKIQNTIQTIKTVGISLNGRLVIITDLEGYVFDCEDTVKFSARTAENAIVNHFYVIMYLKEEDGTTVVETYYDPQGITFGDDYIDGEVYFEICAIDGRTVFADGFEFDYVFDITGEE